ncbi:nitroreductase family deazaflavin-dependent oxidoreductase [Streptomyces sp. CA-111067]|jgi:deazaflavin-dependent oxidoreductase (nitroreductase family)|uniref:nitroreductase family deazaflavin-dependent oxidoreductase n=1 Tax=Streptomyces sp. CA-111067 TaxID=3240046 RepID=UPI003D96C3EF
MSVRRRLARLNKYFGNRIVGRIIPLMPGFGAVYHKGRKSGREYRTPVKVFRKNGHIVLSLPYGSDSDWVKNVVAAGGCEIKTRGRRIPVVAPQVYVDESPDIPRVLAWSLRRFNAVEFLSLKIVDEEVRTGQPV